MQAQRKGRNTIDRLEESGYVESGTTRRSSLKGRKRSVRQTLELFQRQRWGNFWDAAERIWAFPSAQIPSSAVPNWDEYYLTTESKDANKTKTTQTKTKPQWSIHPSELWRETQPGCLCDWWTSGSFLGFIPRVHSCITAAPTQHSCHYSHYNEAKFLRDHYYYWLLYSSPDVQQQ